MNSATVRATRAKQSQSAAIVDLQRRVHKSVSSDDEALLRRWERINQEMLRD